MKLVRTALIGAAALSLAATPAMASASRASALSLGRATTGAKHGSDAVPVIPTWLVLGGLIAAVGAAVVIASDEPDSN
ncbi:hypothetical protein [Sphingomonas hengshuiensis]|uniref:Uncharacterized protein n=1 Tax=Sphingomonas hengshuiensis TaxID=1609977 RepID=A0A7U4JBV8_9SPHN|nr:hypothetical protein [Sphingomonas hengshuiensis]AJP73951.1 hypothetical protein TS85_22320 [Sphingomonas hengshuiensis]